MSKEFKDKINKRISHIETLGKGYGVNKRRISELKWVLKELENEAINHTKYKPLTEKEIEDIAYEYYPEAEREYKAHIQFELQRLCFHKGMRKANSIIFKGE